MNVRLSNLYEDADDTDVVDEPRIFTQVGYGPPPKSPATALLEYFPITIGFLNGAPTDVIAFSIAAGCRWAIGPASDAANNSAGHSIIWLSPLDAPYKRQIAAWWIGGPK